jgi:hypothetical protein
MLMNTSLALKVEVAGKGLSTEDLYNCRENMSLSISIQVVLV